jgi:outer membrane protein TolC
MTPVYFKPKQMLAALMLGGVCAAASASDANDLARVLDSLNGNTPSNDSTAADPLHAGVPLANPAVETFGAPGYRTLASNAVVPAADHAAATNPETTPAAPLLIFGSASAPVRENPTANMFRSLTEHSPALGSKATANPASMAENRPALTGEVAPTADITTTIDLPRALDAATENVLTTKISRGQADQAQARVMGARAAYYPKVSVIAKTPDKIYGATQGYGRTYDEFAQVSSTIQYTVFDFGRRKNQVQSAKLAADASENAYQSEVELLTYNTSRVYLDVIRYQRLHKIADDYVAQVKRLNQVIDERVKGGLAAQSDAIRGQLALTSAQSRSRQIRRRNRAAGRSIRSWPRRSSSSARSRARTRCRRPLKASGSCPRSMSSRSSKRLPITTWP